MLGLRDRLAGIHLQSAPRKQIGDYLDQRFGSPVGGHESRSFSVAEPSSRGRVWRRRSLRIKYVRAKIRVKPQATAREVKTPYHSYFFAIQATPDPEAIAPK